MYLKRNLSKNLTTFHSLRFPYKNSIRSAHRYSVTVGIGGNIGDVKRRFEHLLVSLKRDSRIKLKETSLILKNPPFGFVNQDDFFNSIMVLKVNMQPHAFLSYLMRIEKKFARKRSFANAPRTLDLDILFFDNRNINTSKLSVPHPAWSERESVLIPLAGMKR
ncbi:MAG TPA: 2-amino-4-hydroxy-6-hydroxymethyldihydropteridine diphosphokinase [Sulfurimonas sp. UBA12504]|nr:MAG: 2-amino-4-hydroxy-6-hydroxymethyldihydropteridine diphosphokinase [Sulfurimonas sp. GWF2_37_8]DAB30512.1 MAG TPA: 2-amino-4-hydroxy-6-hydroxymethyldihydropteridine diphosphokinase [Sulfurimonas sp. UBA12504]